MEVSHSNSVVRLSRPNHTHLHTHPGADPGIPEGRGGGGPRKGRSVGIFILGYAQQESGLHCMPPGGRTSTNDLGKRRLINQYNPRIWSHAVVGEGDDLDHHLSCIKHPIKIRWWTNLRLINLPQIPLLVNFLRGNSGATCHWQQRAYNNVSAGSLLCHQRAERHAWVSPAEGIPMVATSGGYWGKRLNS